MAKSIVAALQIGALPEGKDATLEQILSWEGAIIESGATLVVMPEALLGGYPKGEGFGTQLGYRLPEGREAYAPHGRTQSCGSLREGRRLRGDGVRELLLDPLHDSPVVACVRNGLDPSLACDSRVLSVVSAPLRGLRTRLA